MKKTPPELDAITDVVLANEEIGSVGAAIGGRLFIEIGNRCWVLNSTQLFNLVERKEKEQYGVR